MPKSVRNTVVFLLLIVAAVIGLTFYKYSDNTVELNRESLREQGVVLFEKPRIFTFNPLVHHNGTAFAADNLKGRWSLLYFGFTFCPDICPATLGHMNLVMQELETNFPKTARQLDVILVSVDPGRDTPEKLAAYVPFFHKKFQGVTGDINNLKALTQQLNVAFAYVGDTATDDYLVEHSGQVVLVNPEGHYQGFLRPPFQPKELAQALHTIRTSMQSLLPSG